MIKNIPNFLTIIRIFMIIFISQAINDGHYITSLILFTLSALTDIIDGYIARKFDAVSNFGKLMDPLADKLTQLTVLTCLYLKSIIPLWVLLISIIKELFLIIGAAFLYGKDVVVFSRWYGKTSTVMIYIAIVSSMIIMQYNLKGIYIIIEHYLYIIAMALTIISLLLYSKDIFKTGLIAKTDITKEVNNIDLKKLKDE